MKFKCVDDNIAHTLDPRKTKMVVDFNDRESASTKSFVVKKMNEIKVRQTVDVHKVIT